MRKIFTCLLTFLCLGAASCTPNTPLSTPQLVSVYSSYAAEPWLNDVYTCAESLAVILRVDDLSMADIVLRVGEPSFLASFAYQIDEEEILVVTHRESPVQNMTREESQALFMGLSDMPVQLWVYPSDADVYGVFDQVVMEGRTVLSSAKIAATPQQMSDVLNSESNTVGILPRHWKAGSVRDVYSVGIVPVLALTPSEPQGIINQLIGCLQK